MPVPTETAHASHDTTLVSSLADHSLDPSERRAAEALVATCSLCAALHADLLALQAAFKSMPTPARTRDFRLSPADAARARPRGWRRWIATIGGARNAFSRPLAMGLTTLGIVGLLAASVPSMLMMGSAASLPAAGAAEDQATGAPEKAVGGGLGVTNASAPPQFGQPAAAPGSDTGAESRAPEVIPTLGDSTIGKGAPTSGPGRDLNSQERPVTESSASVTVSPLVIVSASLLIVGLGLFALRWGARRFGD